MPNTNRSNLHSRKSSDILLDLFLANNLGGIDHELDDWSDGITDPLHEEYEGGQPVGHWDYFRGTAASNNCATPSILAGDSKVVLFPAPEQRVLPLSA